MSGVSSHQADYSYDTMDRLTKVTGKAAVNGTEGSRPGPVYL